jgi:hypothetical protein
VVGATAARLLVLLGGLSAAACAPRGLDPAAAPAAPQLTPATRQAVEADVRAYMSEVARAVSAQGPGAWRQEFADGPEFFMASDGQLVFEDGAGAARGIEALTHTLPKINLSFGSDLRVDVLTPAFAIVGASYSELQGDAQGQEHTVRGYVTALAELHQGHWRLRDAHWSSRP